MSDKVFTEGGLRYQQFIDQMVKMARSQVTANRIRVNGHGERTNEQSLPMTEEEKQRKRLLLSLSPEDRELIAGMLLDAKQDALHDVCAWLEGMHSNEELELWIDGYRLPVDPFWGTMHMDFISRLDGEEWPEEGPILGLQ